MQFLKKSFGNIDYSDYICIVFFIVLDLRLTTGLSGVPIFFALLPIVSGVTDNIHLGVYTDKRKCFSISLQNCHDGDNTQKITRNILYIDVSGDPESVSLISKVNFN